MNLPVPYDTEIAIGEPTGTRNNRIMIGIHANDSDRSNPWGMQ